METSRAPSSVTASLARAGKVGYALAWMLGVPIPVLLLIFLLRGCN